MIVIATDPAPPFRPRLPLSPAAAATPRPLFSPPLTAIDINTDVLCGNTILWSDAGVVAGL